MLFFVTYKFLNILTFNGKIFNIVNAMIMIKFLILIINEHTRLIWLRLNHAEKVTVHCEFMVPNALTNVNVTYTFLIKCCHL